MTNLAMRMSAAANRKTYGQRASPERADQVLLQVAIEPSWRNYRCAGAATHLRTCWPGCRQATAGRRLRRCSARIAICPAWCHRNGARRGPCDDCRGATADRNRGSTRVHLVGGQAEILPFKDAEFDLVLAVTTLCFIQDAKRVVREVTRVLKSGGRLVIGELGRWSFWAAHRRVRGWFGNSTWKTAMFRTTEDLRDLADAAGLNVAETHGAVHYPPCGFAARLLAPVDLWLGRQTTFGSAFIAVLAVKPLTTHDLGGK